MAEDSDSDDSQKTEDPTPRRIEESFKQGKTFYSKDLTHFLMFICFLVTILILSNIVPETCYFFTHYLENSHSIELNENNIGLILKKIIFKIFLVSFIPLALTFIVAISASFLQTGRFIFSLENIEPKLEKISITNGVKRIFSKKALIEFIKNLVKIAIIGFCGFLVIKNDLNEIGFSYVYEIKYFSAYLIDLTVKSLKYVLIIMFILAIMDYFYQRHSFFSELRMSKYDLKQEYKQTEGNPEVKMKIKQLRRERAKKRMMSAVKTADVVITNPTHYAVALKYEQSKMNAPKLVAKGKDLVALKIKEIARKNDVAIVENPPLARSLYNTEIDEEIAIEHYKLVAEIINYVYKMRKRK